MGCLVESLGLWNVQSLISLNNEGCHCVDCSDCTERSFNPNAGHLHKQR